MADTTGHALDPFRSLTFAPAQEVVGTKRRGKGGKEGRGIAKNNCHVFFGRNFC